MSNILPGGNASEGPAFPTEPIPAKSASEGHPIAVTPLTRAVLELDQYAATLGWDQPARLFALVEAAELRRHDPQVAERLGIEETQLTGALTSIEQEELPGGMALDEFLATIAWPEMVVGCAMVVERLMLPPNVEEQVPSGISEEELTHWVARHPERREVRMTVAVLRDRARESAVRFREKDTPTEVLTGPNLVPGLADALATTFEE